MAKSFDALRKTPYTWLYEYFSHLFATPLPFPLTGMPCVQAFADH